jgi:hypothetical protein
MDGRRIAISKTGLLYCAATIGSFLHVLACTYVCTSAVTRLRSQLQQTSENNRGDRAPITPIKGLPSLT